MSPQTVSFSSLEWADLLGTAPPPGWPGAIRGVQADSRRIRPGEIFVAIDGTEGDGHQFVRDAVDRGAAGVITERPAAASLRVPQIQVESTRLALAACCRAFYGCPDRALHLTGVTGTNGKTSVTRFIRHFFEHCGHPAASLGTVGYSFGPRELPARRTTPSGPDLHEILASAVREGCTHAVMEVSSHALDQERVAGLEFDSVVFTNLSQDHLDYHHTMEQYFEVKSRLFAFPSCRLRVVGDDVWSLRLAGRHGGDVLRCGLAEDCEVRAVPTEVRLSGTVADVFTPWGEGELRLSLPGEHNLRNALQALAVAAAAGCALSDLLEAAETLQAAPGRLQRIPGKVGKVYVDYAHTPDALASVTGMLKQLAQGKVRVVFGCGGDRDRGKRPLMVKAAGEAADELVFTTDNPRTEDPDQIFTDMNTGVSPGMKVTVEPDRAKAIREAVMQMEPQDVLLIAGKGHETVQEVGAVRLPFSDVEAAMAAIAERDEAAGGAPHA